MKISSRAGTQVMASVRRDYVNAIILYSVNIRKDVYGGCGNVSSIRKCEKTAPLRFVRFIVRRAAQLVTPRELFELHKMGNEHGRPTDTDGGGNDDPHTNPPSKGQSDGHDSKKASPSSGTTKSGKPKRKKPEADNSDSDGEKGYESFLKKMDTSKLKHPPGDPIEKYYNVSDKILGMYVFAVFVRSSARLFSP
jgi:hypothetical protein